jgi:hypothetical protein
MTRYDMGRSDKASRSEIDILTRRPLLTFLEHHPAATQNVAAAPAGGTGPP